MALLREALLPACTAIDHPRYMAFIPNASSPAASLVDLLVSVYALYGGSWIEAAGAVQAENEALRWLADLAGFPEGAGGTFVQGGTNGNLSALHAARERARHGGATATRVAVSEEVHSSVRSMLRIMDSGTLEVPGERLTGAGLRAALDADGEGVFAVVATAGTTNLGTIDDLAGVAEVCGERGLWLHVDGAYGLGALCAPSVRDRFAGIERVDSFIVDPHKWLFAPFDSCALIYREPAFGRAAHRQHAGLPRVAVRRRLLQPVRLRRPPHAPAARAAVLVLARRPRHRRLRGGRGAHAGGHARGRGGDPRARRAASWWPSRSCRCSSSAGAAGRRTTTGDGRPVCVSPAAPSYCPPRTKTRPSPASRWSTRGPRSRTSGSFSTQ